MNRSPWISGNRWLGAAAAIAAGGLGMAFYSGYLARRAEEMVPADGKFIEVEGARVHYVDRGPVSGSGPTIVMVHGLGGQLRNFSYALLDRLSVDHRVILIDRPGSGYSTLAKGMAPSITRHGQVVAAVIRALELDRPLLVGHSLGGAVSLSVALEAPELIRGLVLIAPLTQCQTDVPDAFRGLAMIPAAARLLFAQTIATPMGALTGKRAMEVVFAPDAVPQDFATRGGGALSLRPANLANASAELDGINDDLAMMVPRYPGIDLPVSILFGRHDAILDPGLHGHRTAAQIPGTVLETIEGGHMVPVTAPDATLRFVAAALKRTEG